MLWNYAFYTRACFRRGNLAKFARQVYSTLNHRIETKATEQTGHFLGQKYHLRRPVITSQKTQLGVLKYRGVVYGA